MTVGERIKVRREELGLTQLDLAIRMGYKSRAAICNVEKDKEDITTTRIRKFAKALETTPAALMGWASDLESSVETMTKEVSNTTAQILEHYAEIAPKLFNTPEDVKQLDDFLKAFMESSRPQRQAILSLLKPPKSDS